MIKLYDHLTKQIVELRNSKVSIYLCGPTVYDYCHIGHGRSFIVFDVLHRLLRTRYNVEFYQNITDIDDKIINKAQAINQTIHEVTSYYTQRFYDVCNVLNILPATKYTKVSEYIPQIINYIQNLIDQNAAYVLNGNVYFDVRKFEHVQVFANKEPMEEVYENKRYWKDFALWKSGKGEYESPWSIGRPGWHIECSAMLYDTCGYSATIHGGGCDLAFPHHSNEILQSYARFGQNPAEIWIHNGMICVNSIKMSKSLCNSKYLHEVAYDIHAADSFRYWVMSYGYAADINFNEASWTEAQQTMIMIRKYYFTNIYNQNVHEEMVELSFDLPNILQTLHKYIKLNEASRVKFILQICGFNLKPACKLSVEQINNQVQKRNDYRASRSFFQADEIRKGLLQEGVEVRDGSDTKWNYI